MNSAMTAVIEFVDGFGVFEAVVNEGYEQDPGIPQGIGMGATPEDAFSLALADWAKQTGKEIHS
jgi:hypothetical protein